MAGSVYDRRVKPSGWWYAAAAGIALGGILAGLAVAAKGVDDALEAVGSFDRTPVPGVLEVPIDDPGGYSIYQEFPGASHPGGTIDPPNLIVTDPSGDLVDTDSYGTFVSYDQGSLEGRGINTFRAEQTGTFRILASGAPGSTIAVGPGMGDVSAQAVAGIFGGVVGGVILAGTGMVTGTAAAITLAIARGRSRRRRRALPIPIPLAPPRPAIATNPSPIAPAWPYGTPGWPPTATAPSTSASGWWPTAAAPSTTPPGWSPTAAAAPSGVSGWSAAAAAPRSGAPGWPPAAAAAPSGASGWSSAASGWSPTAAPGSAAAAPSSGAAGSLSTAPGQPGGLPGTRVMAAAGAVAAGQPVAGEPTLRGPDPTLVTAGAPEGSAPTEPLSRPGDPQSLRSPVDWSRSDIELPWDGERPD